MQYKTNRLADAIHSLSLVKLNNKDFQTRLNTLMTDIEYLKYDIENEEKQFIVYHLPPEYTPDVSSKYIEYFSADNGFDADDLEQIVNMCQGDRVDLESIIIFRNV